MSRFSTAVTPATSPSRATSSPRAPSREAAKRAPTASETERLGAAFLALHKRVDELYDELVGETPSSPELSRLIGA